MFFIPANLIAQTDTTEEFVADTLSLHDTAPISSEETNISSSKHIYDTSQNFFNWKEDNDEIFSSKKFKPHASTDSFVQKLRNAEDFWYVKAVEKFKQDIVRLQTDIAFRDSLTKAGYLKPDEQVFKQEQKASLITSPWIQLLIWMIIIGVFVYALVYFLLTNKISLFTTGNISVSSPGHNDGEDDIFHLPYNELLQQAAKEKNYRQAVRILYLQTLKMMSEKNIIKFQPDYTNLHYLSQLNKTNYFNEFLNITHHYEYAWYGKFFVSEDRFKKIRADFESIQQKITAA
ncbi:MAG: hypothetical protein ACTHJ5_08530 [Ilyomonas sp.]